MILGMGKSVMKENSDAVHRGSTRDSSCGERWKRMEVPRAFEVSLLRPCRGRGPLEDSLPTCVRMNTLKADVEEVVENLETAGVELTETPLPYDFRVISSPVPLGSSLKHVVGCLYLQDLTIVPSELFDPTFELRDKPVRGLRS